MSLFFNTDKLDDVSDRAKKYPCAGYFYFWWPWSDCSRGSPTRKVQTAHGLFSPTIVSNRRFSSDRAKKISLCGIFLFLVALVGLEPTLLAELDFESSASTNSATGPKQRLYFAADFLASTFLTNLALRVALCTGFFAGFSAFPTFFSIAFLIAAISSVKRDTGFAIT